MGMSRRRFLRKASQAAVLAGSALSLRSVHGGQESQGQPVIPIVDTHQHLWDLSRIRLTWLKPPLDRSFTPKDYTEAGRGLPIVQAVYMEVAVPREQRLQEAQYVLDHCGNADPVAFFPAGHEAPRPARHSPESWKRDMDAMAARSNIVCKISGIVSNVPGYPLTAGDVAPIINHCLDAFGPDRVIFASDWPVCLLGMPLRNWVELLKEVIAGRLESDRRKLFHDNAVRFYGLASDVREIPNSSTA